MLVLYWVNVVMLLVSLVPYCCNAEPSNNIYRDTMVIVVSVEWRGRLIALRH